MEYQTFNIKHFVTKNRVRDNIEDSNILQEFGKRESSRQSLVLITHEFTANNEEALQYSRSAFCACVSGLFYVSRHFEGCVKWIGMASMMDFQTRSHTNLLLSIMSLSHTGRLAATRHFRIVARCSNWRREMSRMLRR